MRASYIPAELNRPLPARWTTEPNACFGIEVDFETLANYDDPTADALALRVLPRRLKRGPVVRIDLPETTERTCRDLRVPLTELLISASAS